MPNKRGQICKIVSPGADLDPGELYIIFEDPSRVDAYSMVPVVGLSDLKRNLRNPDQAKRIPVLKSRLEVVFDDITTYIRSGSSKE